MLVKDESGLFFLFLVYYILNISFYFFNILFLFSLLLKSLSDAVSVSPATGFLILPLNSLFDTY